MAARLQARAARGKIKKGRIAAYKNASYSELSEREALGIISL
jgi:hypothetical protein